jgi:hypothetical protein
MRVFSRRRLFLGGRRHLDAQREAPRAALGERFPVARERESPRQNRPAPREPVALVVSVAFVPERLAERRQDGDRAARATRRVVDESRCAKTTIRGFGEESEPHARATRHL